MLTYILFALGFVILIKGADWKNKEVIGSDLVKKVEFVKYLKQYSTTKIIESIKAKCVK